jgi:predicted HicB family RNase H-like nuclease
MAKKSSNGKIRYVNLKLEEDLHQRARVKAAKRRISLQQLVADAVRQAVDGRPEGRGRV